MLDSIDTSNNVGLRDRALIAMMLFTLIRVSEALTLKVGDYYHQGRNGMLRVGAPKSPLFRSSPGKTRTLTDQALVRQNAWRTIKRRARAAGLPDRIRNHGFLGAGITLYLAAGGTLERAQRMAGHADPRTTKIYDHSEEPITRAEVERIQLMNAPSVKGCALNFAYRTLVAAFGRCPFGFCALSEKSLSSAEILGPFFGASALPARARLLETW